MTELFTVSVVELAPDRPDRDTIYVHLIDLTMIPGIDPAIFLLSPDEPAKERMQKILHQKELVDKLLVDILGDYAQSSLSQNSISRTSKGKPYLTDKRTAINFNISHSGVMMALAVSLKAEVGIDIELIVENSDFIDLAAHLSKEFHQWLLRIPVPGRKLAFYNYWTANEAILKCIGSGLGERYISPDEVAYDSGKVVAGNFMVGYQRFEIFPDFSLCVAALSQDVSAALEVT